MNFLQHLWDFLCSFYTISLQTLLRGAKWRIFFAPLPSPSSNVPPPTATSQPISNPSAAHNSPSNSKQDSSNEEKADFLRTHGADYGYPTGPLSIDQLRDLEFTRLKGILGAYVR